MVGSRAGGQQPPLAPPYQGGESFSQFPGTRQQTGTSDCPENRVSMHGAVNRGTGVPPVRTAGTAVPLRDVKLLKPLSIEVELTERGSWEYLARCIDEKRRITLAGYLAGSSRQASLLTPDS